jgi:hypothetical protein
MEHTDDAAALNAVLEGLQEPQAGEDSPQRAVRVLIGMAGGWLFVDVAGPSPVAVLAKTVERDGRRVITRLVALGNPIDSSTFRKLPIGRVESLANIPHLSASLARFESEDDPLSAVLSAELGKLLGAPHDEEQAPPSREPLQRPDSTDPEGFYRRVAAAYNAALATTSRPAPLLAAEAGVPVATVRRWILEARRRGMLPPGRKGRAG